MLNGSVPLLGMFDPIVTSGVSAHLSPCDIREDAGVEAEVRGGRFPVTLPRDGNLF